MNDRSTYSVKCPFYRMPKEGRKNSIRCEGVEDNQVMELIFSHTQRKMDWQKKYCETFAYLKCPYARLLDDSWKEKLDGTKQKK